MPAFGKDDILNKSQISDVINHVKYLGGLSDKLDSNGQAIFIQNCAVCHKSSGEGDRALGAPNLTDAIWLYGSETNDLFNTVYNSRMGVMPNWNERLSDDTIRQLTIYVHSLGGGE
jgi:cytochrome c oxidase cbb3-type subunit 3